MKKSHLFLGGFLVFALPLTLQLESRPSVRCAGRELSSAYEDPAALELVKAAVGGKTKRITELISSGANPNHLEQGAVPMLLWCICADNLEGFRALVNAGANPNLGGNGEGKGDGKGRGLTEDETIIYSGWSATLLAAGSARPEFLRLALQHGGDPNELKGPRPEHRPLLFAAHVGLFENVKALVSAGADINTHHDQFVGYTAPELAIAGGRFDIATWLVEQGYSYDLPMLARSAESRYVSLGSHQQERKERLIDMLRAKGMKFPSSFLLIEAVKTRSIPPAEVQDLIYGRRNFHDYPLKESK